MSEALPVVLIPGLLDTVRLYAPQLPELWRCGPVMVADHTRDDSCGAIVRRMLANAPPRFALVGLSMGGYLCFEVVRQASERVARLALLDTSARADTPEQSGARRTQVAQAAAGGLGAVVDSLFDRLVHPARRADAALREVIRLMAEEVGVEAFARQQTALIARPDSRPMLGTIRCPTLVLVGAEDQLTPPERAQEIAAGIRGSKLVTVPDCGHMSTLEQPHAVTRALLGWLQG